MKRTTFRLTILLLFFAGSIGLAADRAERKVAKLTIATLTDFHGALEPRILKSSAGSVESGGAGLISEYLRILKEKSAQDSVLIIDVGDLFQGTLISNPFEGRPVVEFYRYLGVDASALGNHEFDFGPVGPDSVPKKPEDDPRGALKERIAQAVSSQDGRHGFSILSANVVDEKGEIPTWLKPSVMVERGGVRVGIIGASTPETVTTTIRANIKGLTFLPPLPAITKEAERLRGEHADVVIAAIHMGGGCADNTNPVDLSSCKADSDLFRLVKELPHGLVDLVLGGHQHEGIAKIVNGVPVVQAYSQGRAIGIIDVLLAGAPKSVIRELVPVCSGFLKLDQPTSLCHLKKDPNKPDSRVTATFMGEKVAADRKAVALLKPYAEQVEELKNKSLHAEATSDFTTSHLSESALGNLIADIMRTTLPEAADVGLMNNGGIRTNLPKGPITFGEIFEIHPFDNELAVLKIDGRILRALVEHSTRGGVGGYSWSGLTFHEGEDCKIDRIQIDGKPLDDKKLYRLATNNFLVMGGDIFSEFHFADNQIDFTGIFIRDAIVDFITPKDKGALRKLRPEEFHLVDHPRQFIPRACVRS